MKYNELGKYIKQQRQTLGKSLNAFALDNDIDPAILCRIENLKQDIKLQILKKIAKGFDMSPAEFLNNFEKTNN